MNKYQLLALKYFSRTRGIWLGFIYAVSIIFVIFSIPIIFLIFLPRTCVGGVFEISRALGISALENKFRSYELLLDRARLRRHRKADLKWLEKLGSLREQIERDSQLDSYSAPVESFNYKGYALELIDQEIAEVKDKLGQLS